MSTNVVADAGPLIGLARIGHLPLLRQLYQKILISTGVLRELRLDSRRPGSRSLRIAVDEGWLWESPIQAGNSPDTTTLDTGEAEAITLAREQAARFLLIDELKGRRVARRLGVPVVGTGGVLLAAKKRGLIAEIHSLLHDLASSGYRLSTGLRAELLRLADESPDRSRT